MQNVQHIILTKIFSQGMEGLGAFSVQILPLVDAAKSMFGRPIRVSKLD
jgi:hypothetical protein